MKSYNKNGYVPGALLSNKVIRDMRKHVEYEKFVARMLIDNEDTRQIRENTENLNDSFHRFLYNNEYVDQHTKRYTDPNTKLENIDEESDDK